MFVALTLAIVRGAAALISRVRIQRSDAVSVPLSRFALRLRIPAVTCNPSHRDKLPLEYRATHGPALGEAPSVLKRWRATLTSPQRVWFDDLLKRDSATYTPKTAIHERHGSCAASVRARHSRASCSLLQ